MGTELIPNRRLSILIAFSVLLLFLTGWFLGKRVPQASADGGVPSASAAALSGGGDSHNTSLSRSRMHEVRADDRISNKVKSLLRLRSNEIGLITMPVAALDENFGPPMDPSISNFPILRNIVDKKSLASNLEGILKQGGAVEVQIIDQSITGYSGKHFQLKLEVIDKRTVDQTTDIYDLRVSITANELTIRDELSVYPGHSLVYRLPAPADSGLVILVGNDPSPATVKNK